MSGSHYEAKLIDYADYLLPFAPPGCLAKKFRPLQLALSLIHYASGQFSAASLENQAGGWNTVAVPRAKKRLSGLDQDGLREPGEERRKRREGGRSLPACQPSTVRVCCKT
ncbi:hypothetical protein E2C01_072978 [Portunus trituberculatus]|uniref:Uncharacterized protein n=1 Tax=Portunus trituberculatus TaxID=210409 RepID=A0A5B7HZI5_PORTR|nr:hypothetical protein [Portunus trituberculatus]